MNIDDLTLKQIKEIQALSTKPNLEIKTFLELGKCYLVRTITFTQ